MNSSDREDFNAAILALSCVFGVELDEAFYQGYWWALSEVSLPDLITACGVAAKTGSRFMPKPGELRELCGGNTAARRTLDAWEAVSRAVIEQGYYRSVTFDDPAINATIRSHGGWMRICCLELEEFEKWFRRDFERTYQVFIAQPPSAEQGSPLIGYCEQTNTFNGYEIESLITGKPHLITTGITPTPVLEDKRAVPALELKKP